MTPATLTINSKNYGSWSLRGWLLCKLAGIEFDERMISSSDPANRAELLLLSPSFLVPRLCHDGLTIWNTLAIAECLNEIRPDARLIPDNRAARARCRSVCGEMHSGFSNLRTALPMNIKARFPDFQISGGARADVDRVTSIWRDCLTDYGGPFLFGRQPCMADAMYAPVCTRLLTYDVKIDDEGAAYCQTIMAMPFMQEWSAAAAAEREGVLELDIEA